MFNLEKCRRILEADGEKYTDEEIKIIYDYLEEMALDISSRISKVQRIIKQRF
ncbi:MAG: hypothetical protein IPP81_09155 [Chitinophagaceae bacterium]|nr:hypothetical protein [Chitinophagaceae bacterium]